MNWAQFKNPLSHLCLAGVVVASWSLIVQATRSKSFNDNFSAKTFRKNSDIYFSLKCLVLI